MPDKYGRFSLDDGLAIAKTVNGIHSRYEIEEKRREEETLQKNIYDAAAKLQKGEPITGYSPEVQYKAAGMKFDQQLKEYNVTIQKHLASDVGRKTKLAELQATNQKAGELYKKYHAARRSGNDDLARQIGHQFNNEVVYNGINVKPSGEGKLSLTKWDQSTEEIDDFPIEKYDEMITGYMQTPPEELAKLQMGGEQLRIKSNADIFSKREPMVNDNGDIVYRIPAGMRDKKTGEIMPAFYIRSLADTEPIPAEQVKGGGYRAMSVQENIDKTKKAKLERDKIKAETARTQARTAKNKKETELLGKPKPTDETKQAADQRKKYKEDLELSLKPFAGSKPVYDPINDTMTGEGKTALDAALKLVSKYENKESLTADEKKKLKYAIRAVNIYKHISNDISSGYVGKQGTPSWKDYR
ncbi:uncharacterized protein Dvar_53770 [Desulfosarcina variabilis str. Montpellier]|uniref:hypothetical protein n=1 Tax=Desulfosarcina variabilis TaxID=2300 RepID=UPI003AFA52FB